MFCQVRLALFILFVNTYKLLIISKDLANNHGYFNFI